MLGTKIACPANFSTPHNGQAKEERHKLLRDSALALHGPIPEKTGCETIVGSPALCFGGGVLQA